MNEIQFWQKAKILIRKGYGANCKVSDLDEFPKYYKNPKNVLLSSRCPSCRAKEIINWIDEHIRLLKMNPK
jgi:hypothetical protein